MVAVAWRGMEECAGPATAVFDPSLTGYDFGPGHPMSPVRVDLTFRLAEALGVFDDRLQMVAAPAGHRRAAARPSTTRS